MRRIQLAQTAPGDRCAHRPNRIPDWTDLGGRVNEFAIAALLKLRGLPAGRYCLALMRASLAARLLYMGDVWDRTLPRL